MYSEDRTTYFCFLVHSCILISFEVIPKTVEK
jgi:hypothetical protein